MDELDQKRQELQAAVACFGAANQVYAEHPGVSLILYAVATVRNEWQCHPAASLSPDQILGESRKLAAALDIGWRYEMDADVQDRLVAKALAWQLTQQPGIYTERLRPMVRNTPSIEVETDQVRDWLRIADDILCNGPLRPAALRAQSGCAPL